MVPNGVVFLHTTTASHLYIVNNLCRDEEQAKSNWTIDEMDSQRVKHLCADLYENVEAVHLQETKKLCRIQTSLDLVRRISSYRREICFQIYS